MRFGFPLGERLRVDRSGIEAAIPTRHFHLPRH
jgi:hypothetical protein